MTYTLWKKTESNISGCPEDESESSTLKYTYIVVPEKDTEEFYESCSEDYACQDYSYQVNYIEIITFQHLEDLNSLEGVIKHFKEKNVQNGITHIELDNKEHKCIGCGGITGNYMYCAKCRNKQFD